MNYSKAIVLTLLILVTPVCCNAQNSGRPNILLIVADDLGFSDIACYGSEIATPNLDKLASRGIRFTQIHNTAKCFPSRACLLTGLYARHSNMFRRPGSIENAVTLGEVLRQAGYHTLWVGKHHGTDHPMKRGFDHYYGLQDGCCNFFNPGNQRPGEGKPAKKRPARTWCIENDVYYPYTPMDEDFYATDYFTKYALKYLEETRKDDRPFFLYVAYTAPHDPLMAWPHDIAKYQNVYDKGYDHIRRQRYRKQLRLGLIDSKTYPLSDETHTSWDTLSPEERETEAQTMAVYAAMIDNMDQNIGKLLEKIEAMGETDNTLVLFTSDNGASAEMVRSGVNIPGSGDIGSMERWTSLGANWANVCNTPFRFYKNYSYEGGICAPMIAYWPEGIMNPDRNCETMGHFIDFMPTFLELAGADYPESFNGEKIIPYEGVSLVPLLKNQSLLRDKPLFWQWWQGRGVVKDKWKLVAWGRPDETEWELYNIKNDKTETNNLAAKRPEIVKEMAALFQQWVEKVQQ